MNKYNLRICYKHHNQRKMCIRDRGNSVKDIDFDHNHGFGDLHARDWKYPSDKAPNKVPRRRTSINKNGKIQLKIWQMCTSIP